MDRHNTVAVAVAVAVAVTVSVWYNDNRIPYACLGGASTAAVDERGRGPTYTKDGEADTIDLCSGTGFVPSCCGAAHWLGWRTVDGECFCCFVLVGEL